jgi:Na+/H+-dicarboxylate symporter
MSLLLGMFFVNVLEPGWLNLSNADLSSASEVAAKTQSISWKFYWTYCSKSIFEALATNEILQIVVFSIFFGLAAASIGDYVKPVVTALIKCRISF